jgi:hypothetical protein
MTLLPPACVKLPLPDAPMFSTNAESCPLPPRT